MKTFSRTSMLPAIIVLALAVFSASCRPAAETTTSPDEKYRELQTQLGTGWGCFNNRNVLSHVLLPEGIALNICMKIKDFTQDNYLSETLISARGSSSAVVRPGYKSYDGSYSELTVTWNGYTFTVESATTADNDIMLLVTPVSGRDSVPSLVLETGFLWNRPGTCVQKNGYLTLCAGSKAIVVRTTGKKTNEFIPTTSKYLAVKLDEPVAFYTGHEMSISQIRSFVSGRRSEQEKKYSKYGELSPVYQAMQGALAWNIIYDPSHKRVICPVSRIWTQTFGGEYVLFDWDTYFSAWMAGLECKKLAYANAVEITKSITPAGFIPNFAGSYGSGSFDRSQPPVGSRLFLELYGKYHDKWLLEYVWNDLLTWNRWWPANRDNGGLLCWGSNPVSPPLRSDADADSFQGAAFESGLDNSPMFDGVPFNKKTHLMEQADAGLTGLYVMDCDALAAIAEVLGKNDEALELKQRADKYRNNLASLWDDKTGIYLNRRTDTGEQSPVLSPTNFYPLLAKAPTQAQADRIVKEHFMNPDEFFGEWMIPSVARNVEAFNSQNYWRGRIWGPMNFLVYLGLRNYDLPEARKILADKSEKLFMDNVNRNGLVWENYSTITGNSDQAEAHSRGDAYYHWGALLGFIQLMEKGYW